MFLPGNYEHDLHLRVSSLNQGRMSVLEYIHEFDQLQIRSSLEEEEQQTMVRFLRGLDLNMSKKVELQPHWPFEDICNWQSKSRNTPKTRDLL